MTSQKPGVLGYQGETSWGRRWDLKLMALPAAQQPVEINRMIDEEGRAFYLVREFEGKPGHRHSGHLLLVERVHETLPADWDPRLPPLTVVWETLGSTAGTRGTAVGLLLMSADVIQAPLGGLERGPDLVVTQWPKTAKAAVRADATTDNDLLLIEAIPGPDPHTLAGVTALCSIHQKAT